MPDPNSEPRRSAASPTLQRRKADPRVRSVVVRLLGVSVVSIGVVGILVIWHLVRRGRLIRDRLAPPRVVPFQDPVPKDPS
jgi:hypothetical protein